ncbi:hypothetical protein Bca52824_016162 [Brassica carinata]|uniref:Uncharacterized protein n=1 Tax=Brassica carinata TaxID=52824 RepID=A0A8X7W367_BRACI|nr:hypothetical protein Bca52824_016162 [Brassica carinata]
MDSPILGSGSSTDPREESDCDMLAPAPISYVSADPPPMGPASSLVVDNLAEWRRNGLLIVEELPKAGTHPAPSEGESTVLRARQLPLDRRQVLDNSVLAGNMSGNVAEDPFLAYQEAAKVVSAKKGSASRTASGDEVPYRGQWRVVYHQRQKRRGRSTPGARCPTPGARAAWSVYARHEAPCCVSVADALLLRLCRSGAHGRSCLVVN